MNKERIRFFPILLMIYCTMRETSMDESAGFVLRALEENWIHARQSEDKRATIATAALFITTAIQIAVQFVGFAANTVLLPVFQALFSIYALLATMKLYERSQFHILRARKLRAHLDELYPNAQVEHLQNVAEVEHRRHYPIWMKVRLNSIWSGLYIGVILLALVEILLCIYLHP
jgi:hypothetical protein